LISSVRFCRPSAFPWSIVVRSRERLVSSHEKESREYDTRSGERWRGRPAKKNALVRDRHDRQRFQDLKLGETEGELFSHTGVPGDRNGGSVESGLNRTIFSLVESAIYSTESFWNQHVSEELRRRARLRAEDRTLTWWLTMVLGERGESSGVRGLGRRDRLQWVSGVNYPDRGRQEAWASRREGHRNYSMAPEYRLQCASRMLRLRWD
jgi:hypothetical protein